MAKKVWTVDICSLYEIDERLVKVLENNSELQKKWLLKQVQKGWIEIIDFWNEGEEKFYAEVPK